MKLTELAQKLNTLGYPLAYSHFNEAQELPFICYLVTDADTFSADNKVLVEKMSVDIELYVEEKNLLAEQDIKDMLNENKLPWTYNEFFIEDEGVLKCTFSITLIY